ncbi:MAG: hypothetical protein WKG07_37040 [Hymenobacter sp.]
MGTSCPPGRLLIHAARGEWQRYPRPAYEQAEAQHNQRDGEAPGKLFEQVAGALHAHSLTAPPPNWLPSASPPLGF